jgi:hypothetical protein
MKFPIMPVAVLHSDCIVTMPVWRNDCIVRSSEPNTRNSVLATEFRMLIPIGREGFSSVLCSQMACNLLSCKPLVEHDDYCGAHP